MPTKCNKPVVVFDSSHYSIVWKTPCQNESALEALIELFPDDTEAISHISRRQLNGSEKTYVCGVKSI